MTDQIDPTEGPAGVDRRSFIRRMAVTGLVAVPVVASFSLVGGCFGGEWPDHGSNMTLPVN